MLYLDYSRHTGMGAERRFGGREKVRWGVVGDMEGGCAEIY